MRESAPKVVIVRGLALACLFSLGCHTGSFLKFELSGYTVVRRNSRLYARGEMCAIGRVERMCPLRVVEARGSALPSQRRLSSLRCTLPASPCDELGFGAGANTVCPELVGGRSSCAVAEGSNANSVRDLAADLSFQVRRALANASGVESSW